MIKTYLTSILIVCCVVLSAGAQELTIQEDSILNQYLQKISHDELRENLSVLAADSFMGRETGRRGQKMAAEFLVKKLRHYKIKGAGDSLDFYQRFELYMPLHDKIDHIIGKDTLRAWKEFYTFSTASDTVYKGNTVTFLGYGIDSDSYSDYRDNESYRGLGVVFLGEPVKNGTFVINNSIETSEWSDNVQLKVDVAQKHGLSALILVNRKFTEQLPRVIYYQKNGRPKLAPIENTKFPVMVIGPEQFNRIFPKLTYNKAMARLNDQKNLKNSVIEENWEIRYHGNQEKLLTENVLGMIRGKELPDEYIFITAHYDHLGKDDDIIYNGADDDGSGTSSLLEIARLFSLASLNEKSFPKRSIVFLWVSGEEKGLLGSRYYTDNPLYPLDQTVVDLNIDMVGRRDSLHSEDDPKYIYLIGSDKLSSELHTLSEKVNDIYSNYELDYTFNDDNHPSRLYYRSDHYNFAKNNIPVIFYFGGMHEDYHQPTDDVEKIDFDILSGVTKLIMGTAWHIANAEKRIEVDNPVRLVR